MEILSPASNLEHVKIAIDENSNAVYGGLKKWNARNKAINFSDSEYNYIIDLLHENNIKFFLTLNILMLDEEIEEVINFLKNNKLPDAFIVTDIGLITELHKEFPNVPLHFSTQFGAHNIDDVNYIESLNGERAILSRELTLDEINKIKENVNIELECFIWGSQCISFSGLCFFGTLINGGGGNRGKCIITCRDVYSVNNVDGNYLYVPDMDCINLINKLNDIHCLKLEGRRRPPEEIKDILNQINNKINSENNIGYLNGISVKDNKLFEQINKRIKPVMQANKLKNISIYDVCVEYENDIPIKFSKDYDNPNVKYVYSEIKKDYLLNKKNISIDVSLSNDNKVTEILYVNHKGEGHTFVSNDESFIPLELDSFINGIESINDNINLYKIKYKKQSNKVIEISVNLYKEVINYIINDCTEKEFKLCNNEVKFNKIYLDTNDLNVIDKFVDDEFVKIIYDISCVDNLKKIDNIISLYSDKIIYKLPIFNWKSDNLTEYYKKLENKEVMFTRFTQIYLTKNIKFKKKYTDYLIYIWNKKSLSYLEQYGIDEYTASPELSFYQNKEIFSNKNYQTILCGKLPLVYTRNCFGHIFGCKNCHNNYQNKKNIKNVDKNLDFEIYCNSDYRYLLNSNPILNDFSKFDIPSNISFRYISLNQDMNTIIETIEMLKKQNYYENMKNSLFWKESYECNMLEGKD